MDATRAATVGAVRDRVLRSGSVVSRADGRARTLLPVAIGGDEAEALRTWVERENATATLEIGLGFAVGTLAICEALAGRPGARHVAIDPYQSGEPFAGIGLQLLEEAGVRDLVELHEDESQLVLPRLLAEGRQFDLAFVDGSHRFESVFLDLVYAARLVREGGVVFVDDVQLPAVRKAVDFCTANLAWRPAEDGSEGDHHAWRVLRTGTKNVFGRPYDRFTDF